jgi:hypothetical protein
MSAVAPPLIDVISGARPHCRNGAIAERSDRHTGARTAETLECLLCK